MFVAPCNIGEHRHNIFARALAKLQAGASEAEIKDYFQAKGLKGNYVAIDNSGKISPVETGGHTPWDLLQSIRENPKKRPTLSEVVVTNHNKEVVAHWEKEGLGSIVNQDGLRIFQKNAYFDQSTSNWDYGGAHGDLAMLSSGDKTNRTNLYVLRNTWQTKGLTKALHEAMELAPPELKDVYARAARKTVQYIREGRTDRRLIEPDAATEPGWVKNNYLKEAKAVKGTSEALEKYVSGQMKAGRGVTARKLQEFFFSKKAGAASEAMQEHTASKLPKVIRAADALPGDPRIVLDPNQGNYYLQVAREFLLTGLAEKMPEMKQVSAALGRLIRESNGAIPAKATPIEALRMLLRDPNLRTSPKWINTLWDLKKAMKVTRGHPLDQLLSDIWGEPLGAEARPIVELPVDLTTEQNHALIEHLKATPSKALNQLYNRVRGRLKAGENPRPPEIQIKLDMLPAAFKGEPKPESVQTFLQMLQRDPALLEWTKQVTNSTESKGNMWDAVTKELDPDAVDSINSATEKAPEAEPELEAIEAYDAYEAEPPPIDTVTLEELMAREAEEAEATTAPAKEATAEEYITAKEGEPPALAETPEPLPEVTIATQEVSGAPNTMPLEVHTTPETPFETGGELITKEEVKNFLESIPTLSDEMKHTLIRAGELTPEAVVKELVPIIKNLPPSEAKALTEFINLWNSPEGAHTLENFSKALDHIRCLE